MSGESIRETLYSRPMEYTVMIAAAIAGTALIYNIATQLPQLSRDADEIGVMIDNMNADTVAAQKDLIALLKQHETVMQAVHAKGIAEFDALQAELKSKP